MASDIDTVNDMVDCWLSLRIKAGSKSVPRFAGGGLKNVEPKSLK
jgi:hypothetical protein